MRTIIFALSALALGTTGVAASARDFVVPHGDLDLTEKTGQESLKQRIDLGAREYCASYSIPFGTRSSQPELHSCVAEVTKLANKRMAALVDQAGKGG